MVHDARFSPSVRCGFEAQRTVLPTLLLASSTCLESLHPDHSTRHVNNQLLHHTYLWSLPKTRTRVNALLKPPPHADPCHLLSTSLLLLLPGIPSGPLSPSPFPLFTSFLLQAGPQTAPFIHLCQLPQVPLALHTCPDVPSHSITHLSRATPNVKCHRTKSHNTGPDVITDVFHPLRLHSRAPSHSFSQHPFSPTLLLLILPAHINSPLWMSYASVTPTLP